MAIGHFSWTVVICLCGTIRNTSCANIHCTCCTSELSFQCWGLESCRQHTDALVQILSICGGHFWIHSEDSPIPSQASHETMSKICSVQYFRYRSCARWKRKVLEGTRKMPSTTAYCDEARLTWERFYLLYQQFPCVICNLVRSRVQSCFSGLDDSWSPHVRKKMALSSVMVRQSQKLWPLVML